MYISFREVVQVLVCVKWDIMEDVFSIISYKCHDNHLPSDPLTHFESINIFIRACRSHSGLENVDVVKVQSDMCHQEFHKLGYNCRID